MRSQTAAEIIDHTLLGISAAEIAQPWLVKVVSSNLKRVCRTGA
ncbi:MAG: hypothetical protein ACRDY0_00195 [Acidimicrobiales bacterium]